MGRVRVRVAHHHLRGLRHVGRRAARGRTRRAVRDGVGLGHSLVKRERLQRVRVGRRRRIDEVQMLGLLASRGGTWGET